jgi:hypothetical protein
MKTAKIRRVKDRCPSCKKPRWTYDSIGCLKRVRCTNDFHTWFCSNNYTARGCLGHRPGDLRCMDLG